MYARSKLNKKLNHEHIFFSNSYLQKVDKDNPHLHFLPVPIHMCCIFFSSEF